MEYAFVFTVVSIAIVALFFGVAYSACVAADRSDRWMQKANRSIPLRPKRARVDRAEEDRTEAMGRALREVREDLKRRRDRDKQARSKVARKK